ERDLVRHIAVACLRAGRAGGARGGRQFGGVLEEDLHRLEDRVARLGLRAGRQVGAVLDDHRQPGGRGVAVVGQVRQGGRRRGQLGAVERAGGQLEADGPQYAGQRGGGVGQRRLGRLRADVVRQRRQAGQVDLLGRLRPGGDRRRGLARLAGVGGVA